ncbi:hypothetical protein W97_01365 [Coniosporium apollinis CBS 100218]|uniref:Uncharacterized protein n=1 Tax=Coniosporium apollinis (strain CBS 100218) TaxID=1168221 RepID=R7YKL1_CONA1|nr:uncharacterized protein W97_01365 [Coniosporium apollinis CBS 100218]EON62146.1 hypothetical protein W97_01365 [Coniosporium apollinis CBS 100218]
MPDFKEIAKSGWHPKSKSGKAEGGWRSEFKGADQIAGWIGKKKGSSSGDDAANRQSAPLSSLKDPAAFGPPPKHVGYHGGAAVPHKTTPDPSGWGAPIPQEEVQAQRQIAQRPTRQAEEEEEEKPPPGPYRVDTTGLSTANLPPPPVRRVNNASPSPQLPAQRSAAPPAQRPKPSLPPRLPPRQNSHPDAYAPTAPPAYNETAQAQSAATATSYINQGALNRLGNAGVSVPGFDIGRTAPPPVAPRSGTLPPPPTLAAPSAGAQSSPMNTLQSGFSKLSTRSTPTDTAGSSSTGTTWAQKREALNTANSLRNDPSKVSLSDARNAASTASNFRERHGEQVTSTWQAASGLNQKYGIADKLNNYNNRDATRGGRTEPQSSAAVPDTQHVSDNPWASETSSSTGTSGLGRKAPPPPPPIPKKRPELTGGAPPPIPLGSKPRGSSYQDKGQKTIYAMPPGDAQDFGGG